MFPRVIFAAPGCRTAVRRAALSLSVALSVLAGPVAAQELGDAELRALRYYVEQNDMRSAKAEIQRLMQAHPGWRPPANLSELKATTAAPAGPGEEANRIWKLIEIGNWGAARGRLDHLRASYPDWTPPAEMMSLVATGEGQSRFDRAVAVGDAATAISVARQTPQLLRCDRVNNAWQLALMQQKSGDTAGALASYRGVLGSCTDPSVLVATLEKANDIGTDAQLREMADFARQSRPSAKASIDAVETRLLAGRGRAPAAVQTARPAPALQASAPVKAAAPVTGATEAPAPVAPAPTRSVRMDALPAQGDGRVAAVRQAARAGDWTGCLARSANPRSVDVLYERGWCAMNRDRSFEALAAFQVASTAPLGAVVQRDARYGMALAMLANHMTEDAARVAAVTDLTNEQRLEIESMILDQRGVRAFKSDDFRAAITYFDALEELTGSIRRDLAILRGYAYLESGQRQKARAEFERLHDQLATAETRKGLNAAIR
ncbi:hypothetical protein [Palleronia sp.]|uniref:hypothetical protein n=1 Tax=Palleronia sp. TaxID=1940284 RepID=UPI0035C86265